MKKNSKKRKALFLDRDGVINVDSNYVHKIEEVHFMDGIFEFCEYFQKEGYLIFVVTNQAGIARGYYTIDDFQKLSGWMVSVFKKKKIIISKIYFCPHHPEITGSCDCRKPNPGMILRAAGEYDLELSDSVLVGNHESDVMAGKNAGIKRNYIFNEPADFSRIINEEKKTR
jgi:D-glycero-D-manno-heptose 1,7-bisphosphate phosphatase